MKSKTLILVSAQLVAVFVLGTPALAIPITHTTTYSNVLTTGAWDGPGSATTT